MNTVLLQYAVEVEKTGSITQAANNLFMDQPNLSKAIKALEETMGAPIFKRTSKGMVPTVKGKVFLEYARSILTQLDEMEALYNPKKKLSEFSLSIPRASYISYAFSRFIGAMENRKNFNIWLRETNSISTIQDVEGEEYQLGIIRYFAGSERYYHQLLTERKLENCLVWEYNLQLLMSEEHPLASLEKIDSRDLEYYTEIIHGDVTGPEALAGTARKEVPEEGGRGRIYVFERGSQFNLLQMNPDTYMWVSPLPKAVLRQHKLVTKPSLSARPYKDVMIWRSSYEKSRWDAAFIEELNQVKAEINSYC